MAPVRRRLSAEEAARWAKEGKKAYGGDGRPVLVVRGFRIERVFDESQTEPMAGHDPVLGPAAWTEQSGAGPQGLWEALVGIVEGDGFVLEHRPAVSGDGGAHGWTDYRRRIVWVNSACEEAEQVLAAAGRADDGVVDDADVGDVSRPRRRGAGRGLVVAVARCPSGRRWCGDHSAVTSATAARVEDSSTMALSEANAATRAWSATLLTARG